MRARLASIGLVMLRVAVSAVAWMLLIGLVGGCLIVAGVYTLAGAGWAMIAGGIAAIGVAHFIRKGLTDG